MTLNEESHLNLHHLMRRDDPNCLIDLIRWEFRRHSANCKWMYIPISQSNHQYSLGGVHGQFWLHAIFPHILMLSGARHHIIVSAHLSAVSRGTLQPLTGSSAPPRCRLIQGRAPPWSCRWGRLLCC